MDKQQILAKIEADKQALRDEQIIQLHEKKSRNANIVYWWLREMDMEGLVFEMLSPNRFRIPALDVMLWIDEDSHEIYHAAGSRVTYVSRPAHLASLV